MSLDVTGEPFASPNCVECATNSLGLYNFNCRRCEARAYVRAPLTEQKRATHRWRNSLSAEQLDAMKKMIDEERAKG